MRTPCGSESSMAPMVIRGGCLFYVFDYDAITLGEYCVDSPSALLCSKPPLFETPILVERYAVCVWRRCGFRRLLCHLLPSDRQLVLYCKLGAPHSSRI